MAWGYELVPTNELSDTELQQTAQQLSLLVDFPDTRRLLKSRHLWGVVQRHGLGVHQSRMNLERARSADPKILSAFIVVRTVDAVPVGMASKQPNVTLQKQRLPMPAGVSRRGVARTIETSGTHIAAWTAAYTKQYESLAGVYRELRQGTDGHVWTVEPLRSDIDIRLAITDSGMKRVETGRFDDEESGWRIPPTSTLYESHI